VKRLLRFHWSHFCSIALFPSDGTGICSPGLGGAVRSVDFGTGYQNQSIAAAHPTCQTPKSAHHPANVEAGDFYLQGRFYWNQRTADSLTKPWIYLHKLSFAIPTTPRLTLGLADCLQLASRVFHHARSEAYPRALAAAKKAVELDGQSSEAHASLAFVSFYGMWDAVTADREFRRALALNPTTRQPTTGMPPTHVAQP